MIITPAALDIPEPTSATLSKPSSLAQIRAVSNRSRFGGGRSQGSGSRTSSVPAPSSEPPDTVIKVFTLQHAKAANAVDVLTQLIEDGNVVADERTNSVIARGVAAELAIVEKLLLQLDGPASESPKDSPAGETRDRPSLEEFLRSLRAQYSSREAQALSVAQTLAAKKDAEAARREKAQTLLEL